MNKMVSFIHIGKCGGTTIHRLLKSSLANYKQYHLNKEYNLSEKYILWIRNPLSRFVSAFNMSKTCLEYNFKKEDIHKISMHNCLAPARFINKLRLNRNYVFSPQYDKLIKFFKTPNGLAEALSSDNSIIKKKALRLINSSQEHINKGIGWYLNNGKFVENNINKILFVGKQETMKEDIEKLSGILNINLNIDIVVRENIYSSEESKYLSPIAITNLIEFYKNTDYAALKQLNKYGWISDEVLASYYKYS